MTASTASKPTPVFVLGVQRSGTTWLANVLAQHSRATAIQSEDHFGIHESIFFSHFAPAYGDLDDESNFRRFIDDFTSSDYYLLSGLEPSWLARTRPRDYPEAFRVLMDEVARRRSADLWIEKSPSHTQLAEDLAAAFPDAYFVCVVRQAQAAIASQLWLHGKPPPYPSRLRVLLSKCLLRAQQRLLVQFCQRHEDRCFLTTYENFEADPEGESQRACRFLGISYEQAMLDLPWHRNTSFRSVGRRRRLGLLDRFIVMAASTALTLLPLSVLRSLIAWRRFRRLTRRGGVIFPEWCWRRRDAGTQSHRETGVSLAPPRSPHRL